MKRLYIYSLLMAGAVLAGCSSENPFTGEEEENGVGVFSKDALNLDVRTEETIKQKAPTRAGNDEINLDDFKIVFNNASTGEAYTSYRYADMPDIVELPAGTYTIYAEYGEDQVAAHESPYYVGRSDEFVISSKSITSDIGTIQCNLNNVKTSVYFDPTLVQHMDDNAYVEVKLGNYSTSSLRFNKEHSKNGTAGYFKAGSETTLVATFKGNIDGYEVNETKTLNGVAAGNHYRFTFKLHNHKGETTGSVPGTIEVDASVSVTDVNLGVELKPDEVLDDDERPTEDPEPGTENPPTPPTEGGPTVTAREPINLDGWNDAYEGLQCILDVHSDTGITGFTVKIDSDTLAPLLGDVGLAKEFDLITGQALSDDVEPGKDLEAGLSGLELPVKNQVKDQTDVIFNVSDFMGLLGIYGAADHKFVLTVTDAGGTTVKELKLRTK